MKARAHYFPDEGLLREYAEATLIPLKESAEKILYLTSSLKEKLDRRNVSELMKDLRLRRVLLGGVNLANGKTSERSLMELFSSTVGLEYDLKRYITGIYAGEEPDTISVSFKETELTELASLVSEVAGYALGSFRIPLEQNSHSYNVDAEKVLDGPEKLSELTADFLNRCLSFTAGYNPHTFFVWSMRKNTKKFIDAVFGGLNEERFEGLRKILGLEKLFAPELGDPSLYTVWGYPEYRTHFNPDSLESLKWLLKRSPSPGGKISLLNETIWIYFERKPAFIEMSVLNPPEPLKEYLRRAEKLIDERPKIGPGYSFFKGIFKEGSNITLMEALDSISQHQYLGLWEYFIEKAAGDTVIRIEERGAMI